MTAGFVLVYGIVSWLLYINTKLWESSVLIGLLYIWSHAITFTLRTTDVYYTNNVM